MFKQTKRRTSYVAFGDASSRVMNAGFAFLLCMLLLACPLLRALAAGPFGVSASPVGRHHRGRDAPDRAEDAHAAAHLGNIWVLQPTPTRARVTGRPRPQRPTTCRGAATRVKKLRSRNEFC